MHVRTKASHARAVKSMARIAPAYFDAVEGTHPAELQVLSHGIELTKYQPATRPLQLPFKKSLVFLFNGGLLPRKGIDILLQVGCDPSAISHYPFLVAAVWQLHVSMNIPGFLVCGCQSTFHTCLSDGRLSLQPPAQLLNDNACSDVRESVCA